MLVVDHWVLQRRNHIHEILCIILVARDVLLCVEGIPGSLLENLVELLDGAPL